MSKPSVSRDPLCQYLDDLLQPQLFKDACPNGLQVLGTETIHRCVSGVTACQALIAQAVAQQAQMMIVHHGLFWKGDPYPVVGIKHARLKPLVLHDVNLFAYHLPLDCHRDLGNNAQIGLRLPLREVKSVTVDGCPDLLWHGELTTPLSVVEVKTLLTDCFSQSPLQVGPSHTQIQRIAWCSGAAQKYIKNAYDLGVDAFISGEISEQTTHLARELGIDYFACGHHATERFGVQALGQALAAKFNLEVIWVDVPNPV